MFCRGFGSYGFGSSGFIGGGFLFIIMGIKLLILAAIIVFAVKIFKKYTNGSINALKMLDERFAKGEISEDEYIKRKAILSQKN